MHLQAVQARRRRATDRELVAGTTDPAVRTNGSYLQALYRRLRPRVGHGRALGAVKHSMICACWQMLSGGELYRRDPGGDYFLRRDPERQTRRLVSQLEAFGHTVMLQEPAA